MVQIHPPQPNLSTTYVEWPDLRGNGFSFPCSSSRSFIAPIVVVLESLSIPAVCRPHARWPGVCFVHRPNHRCSWWFGCRSGASVSAALQLAFPRHQERSGMYVETHTSRDSVFRSTVPEVSNGLSLESLRGTVVPYRRAGKSKPSGLMVPKRRTEWRRAMLIATTTVFLMQHRCWQATLECSTRSCWPAVF